MALYLGSNKVTPVVKEAGGDTIAAINNTGVAISSGDKVWLNPPSLTRNFDVTGSPTIDDETGIVSNLSTSNYISTSGLGSAIEDIATNRSYTFKMKLTSYSEMPATLYPVGWKNINNAILSFSQYYTDNPLLIGTMFGSAGTTSYSIGFFETSLKLSDITLGEWFWIRILYGPQSLNVSYSTDGENFTGIGSDTLGANVYKTYGDFRIVGGTGDFTKLQGLEFDLSECYHVKDGAVVWRGYNGSKNYSVENLGSPLLYEFSGAPKGNVLISNNMASDFAQNSYVEYTQAIDFSVPWEFNTCVYRNSTDYAIDRNGFIFSAVDSTGDSRYNSGFSVYCDTKVQFSRSTGEGIVGPEGSLSANKTYYIKCGWTGAQYYIKQSEDGVTYTTVATKDSTTPCVQTNTKINIGSSNWVSGFYWHGYIYLQDTFIVQNGQKVFSCCTNKNSLTGVAKENIASGSTGSVLTILPQS